MVHLMAKTSSGTENLAWRVCKPDDRERVNARNVCACVCARECVRVCVWACVHRGEIYFSIRQVIVASVIAARITRAIWSSARRGEGEERAHVEFAGKFRDWSRETYVRHARVCKSLGRNAMKKRAVVYKNSINMINVIRDKNAKTTCHSATREGLPITIICSLPITIISRSSLPPICRIPQCDLSINSLTRRGQLKTYKDMRRYK